ncbi:MAG: putative zinc-binding metallopeptidase [Gammaproteobacteria bacterium]
MRPLACRCGQAVHFDNDHCTACSRALAFDPASLAMASETEPGAGMSFCAHRNSAVRCNWLAPGGGSCLSCRMSRIIPTLAKEENRSRWRKLESAKRRLIYDLLALRLPVDPGHLEFVFKEDRRTNPDVSDDHVGIGHRDGVITINAAEADEVYRERMRQAMNEPVRTLLGHFRHESGHYYFDLVVQGDLREAARDLFGDERADYEDAMQRYYEAGPPNDWSQRFISAYASAHPAEDWAECWAHYLHIQGLRESAHAAGWVAAGPEPGWYEDFVRVVIGLNDMVRSLGLPDAYPFVVTGPVAKKLEFVHHAIGRFTNRPGVPSA